MLSHSGRGYSSFSPPDAYMAFIKKCVQYEGAVRNIVCAGLNYDAESERYLDLEAKSEAEESDEEESLGHFNKKPKYMDEDTPTPKLVVKLEEDYSCD
jgi:hypothetical protein